VKTWVNIYGKWAALRRVLVHALLEGVHMAASAGIAAHCWSLFLSLSPASSLARLRIERALLLWIWIGKHHWWFTTYLESKCVRNMGQRCPLLLYLSFQLLHHPQIDLEFTNLRFVLKNALGAAGQVAILADLALGNVLATSALALGVGVLPLGLPPWWSPVRLSAWNTRLDVGALWVCGKAHSLLVLLALGKSVKRMRVCWARLSPLRSCLLWWRRCCLKA
jgi:hypothetical protein